MRGGRKRRGGGGSETQLAPSRPLNWRTPGALFLIVAFAAFLRLFQITTIPPALCSDEAINGNDGLEAAETGHYRIFYPQNGGREGLFINIQSVFVSALGNKAWVLRLPSTIFGILTVWGIYFCARELFRSVPIGLAASFLLATSFWHVNFSRIGLRAICAPMFLVWAVYLAIDGLERAENGRPYLGRMAWAGVVYGLGFHTYLAYRVTPPVIGIILLASFLRARRQAWLPAFARATAVFAAASAVIVAPLAVYFVAHRDDLIHRSAEVSIFTGNRPAASYLLENVWKMTQMIFTKGDFDWLHNIAFRPAVFLPVALLFALGIGVGIYEMAQRRWFPYAVLFAWLILGSVPAVLSKENMPNSIRAILMIPAICMLAAVGGVDAYVWVCVRVKPRGAGGALRAAAAAMALVLGYECYHSYFDVWAKSQDVTHTFNSAGYEIAERILAAPPSSQQYVVAVLPGTLGIPPSAQTVMFLTRTYTERQRAGSNVHYVARETPDMPDGAALCQQVAASLRAGDVHCLQLIHKPPPAF